MEWDRYAVVDVETTGFSPRTDRLVEVACVLVDGAEIAGSWSTLVNPGIPIPWRASQVHGIRDSHVAGAPNPRIAMAALESRCAARLLVAHSAPFDLSFLGWPAQQALCTVRLARALFPEAPDHKNQTLRAFLRLDRFLGDLGAHRALDDALVTAHILMACRRRFRYRYVGQSWNAFVRRALVHAPLEQQAS
jgi:DNA polymerase III epsilon subunit-like protein